MSTILNQEPQGLRCGYVRVHEAKENNLNGEMEYSMQIIIPKNSATHKQLNQVIGELMTTKWGNNPPPNLRLPLRDADAEAAAKKKQPESHMANSFFMNVRSKERPQIVGPDGFPMGNPEECRSGDYYHISLGGFTYLKPNPGISFGLNNCQWVRKGDTLTGRKRAEDEFGAVEPVAAVDPMFDADE